MKVSLDLPSHPIRRSQERKDGEIPVPEFLSPKKKFGGVFAAKYVPSSRLTNSSRLPTGKLKASISKGVGLPRVMLLFLNSKLYLS